MTIHGLGSPISRNPRRPQPGLPFLRGQSLSRGRVHEFCGPARQMLALLAAAKSDGPVFWLRPGWLSERLCPDGVVPFAEPGRLIFVTAARDEDLLWSFEESLRAGAAALVIAELPAPPGLTPVRRLQLAAETGAQAGTGTIPTGLILTPGTGGARGVESRWHARADHQPGQSRWQVALLHSRVEPPGCWTLSAGSDRGGTPTLLTLSRPGTDRASHEEMTAPDAIQL